MISLYFNPSNYLFFNLISLSTSLHYDLMVNLNSVLKNDSTPEATVRTLQEFWDKALFHPWEDIKGRPNKAIRGDFVRLGWHLAGSPDSVSDQTLLKISEIIETIHLGSLIIDDIEDNSLERRGGPTLHNQYGLPLALNLGNFLYFHALTLISQLDLSQDYKNAAMNQITHVLRDAHLGQALDVSIAIDQVCRTKIPKLVETSLRLKSGALMKLSVHLGALTNPEFANWEALHGFGESFGSCLQKFDDIGNLNLKSESKKHLEDLILRRPTWIWAVHSQCASEDEWAHFLEAVRCLPDTEKLEVFLNGYELKKRCFDLALQDLEFNLNLLKDRFSLQHSDPAYQLALQLTKKLTYAY